MRLFISTLLLTTFLFACSKEKSKQIQQSDQGVSADTSRSGKVKADVKPLYHVDFRLKKKFNSSDSVIVGVIASFVIDNQNRVFIADEDRTRIEVFNPDGSYLTSLGRQGKGPGEFSVVASNTLIKIHSNKLYVPDYVNGSFFPTRLQVFSLDSLAFIHTIQMLSPDKVDYDKVGRYYPNRIYPRGDGTFLVGYRRFPGDYRDSTSFIRYMIQDGNGQIMKGPILVQKDRINLTKVVRGRYPYRAVETFPFFERSLLAMSDEGKLYTARTGHFKIDVYDSAGKHLRSFRQSFSNKPFNKAKVIHRYKKTGYKAALGDGIAVEMVRNADNLPDTWPAMDAMFFDDKNRLWVATIIKSNDVYKWWILKPSGKVITTFKWPRSRPIKKVRNGFMYTRETNTKGVNQIVKYKIKFKKNR